MRCAIAVFVLMALWLSACGPSRAERVYQVPALGERLSPGSDLVFPARLRSNEGVDGRLVVTESSFLFHSDVKEDASQRWEFRNVRALHRPNSNEIVIELFEGSGYIFELLEPGMADRDFKLVLGRVALARDLR